MTTTEPAAGSGSGPAAAAETPWWQEPPTRTPQAAKILDRIGRRRWNPAESTLWRPYDQAAKRAGVHEWEWRNPIIHGYCAQAAADPNPRWPVLRLPHCPTQVFEPLQQRDGTRGLEGLCLCPEPDTDRWPHPFYHRVHWVAREGVELYCHCGGNEDPPGSGVRGGINDFGYVCARCAPRLTTRRRTWNGRESTEAGHVGDGTTWSHPLVCDCRCCYCGAVAERARGWRLTSHPPILPAETEPSAPDG